MITIFDDELSRFYFFNSRKRILIISNIIFKIDRIIDNGLIEVLATKSALETLGN